MPPPPQQGLRRDVVWDVSPESPYEVFKGTELRNKTLGLVGYGNIGRRVARIARAFGMAVLVVDPFVAAEDINEPGYRKRPRRCSARRISSVCT